MNMRWLWLDHFPPGLELAVEQRREARRRARLIRAAEPALGDARRKAVRMLAFWCTVLTLVFVAWVLRDRWLPWRPRTTAARIVLIAVTPLLFNAAIWVAIALTLNRAAAPYVRAALSTMGFPTCVRCGYLLTGSQAGAACPECGATPTAISLPDIQARDGRIRGMM